MKVSCYQIDAGGTLLTTTQTEILDRWRAGDGVFWLDASAYDRQELEGLLEEVGVTGFLKHRCLQQGRGTGAFALPNGTFAEWDMDGASGFLEPERASTAEVLCGILLSQGARTTRKTKAIRDRLLELGQIMDDDIDAVDPLELEHWKRSVLLVDGVAEEQQEAFALIAQASSRGLEFSDLEAPLGLLQTSASATVRLNDRMDERIANLLRRIQDRKQELLNRRLGVLTIISAIFLPLTLMAGIWGMNFENMRELSNPRAYPIALGLMAALAASAAWIFYKRGWFD